MPENLPTALPWIWAAAGCLIWLQVLLLDILGIRAGHPPGTPISPESGLLFRAHRSLANSNESIAAFILLSGAAALLGHQPFWLTAGSALWLAARLGHMLSYYAGLAIMRSLSFAASMLGLLALIIACLPWSSG